MARRRLPDEPNSKLAVWSRRFAFFSVAAALIAIIIVRAGLLEVLPGLVTFGGALAFGAFAGLFVLGVVARSLWEIVRAPVVAPLRRLRGHPERARRTGDVARARLRFLERDVAALLRSTARPRERAVTRPAVVSDPAG